MGERAMTRTDIDTLTLPFPCFVHYINLIRPVAPVIKNSHDKKGVNTLVPETDE
jgi:hypothetical protein